VLTGQVVGPVVHVQPQPDRVRGRLVLLDDAGQQSLGALQTLGFSEIPKPLIGHATTLSTMTQQVSLTFGVELGAALVNAAAWLHGGDAAHLTARDFSPAFFVVGFTTLLSLFFFLRLDPQHGESMRG